MSFYEFHKDHFTISTDPSRIRIDVVHNYLANHAYWSRGRSREIVERSVRNSLCFSVYDQNNQIGFARVCTDYAVFAYLMDVFILETHRGEGLGKWLISCILEHPDLNSVTTWLLKTRDAHSFYSRYGFSEIKEPEWYMEYRK